MAEEHRLRTMRGERRSAGSDPKHYIENAGATVPRGHVQPLRDTTGVGPQLYILGCHILLRQMTGAGIALGNLDLDQLIHQGMKGGPAPSNREGLLGQLLLLATTGVKDAFKFCF
ncbi:uncharacterized protein N7482_010794 [Penicillium canariense]|uniref:Uncharacterized protein n=1 Tax=Penicillium canariense TaxID=189055 RepID=A0A9W9HM98_9EURO|nr:uncharacterized protein N7482_010794 [Penicillium canariense]KAJ5150336.1 hypothetical protein N7482_010794 [Penicillium canariense]